MNTAVLSNKKSLAYFLLTAVFMLCSNKVYGVPYINGYAFPIETKGKKRENKDKY